MKLQYNILLVRVRIVPNGHMLGYSNTTVNDKFDQTPVGEISLELNVSNNGLQRTTL